MSTVFFLGGGMLFVDGVAEAYVTTRICSGWFKFRSLACFLKDAEVCVLTYLFTYFLVCAQPQSCPECGKQLKSEKMVKQHMRIVHRGALQKCPRCGLGFRQRRWLDWHVLCHSEQQPFTCNQCQPGQCEFV